ncbi:MAG: type II toxin-antitoxin system prevent-host-death family antitoxin [Deltaproteobacteria bacterium]
MREVNVTELRSHLPAYLGQVQTGEELVVTSHGKAIARIVPSRDISDAARKQLKALRNKSYVGDVISPVGELWEAEK